MPEVRHKSFVDDESDQYRNVVRSKILKRIYDKTQDSIPFSVESEESSGKSSTVVAREDEDKDRQISQQVKRHLSNEWRKTLERVLNYDNSFVDGQLEVSRKDSIRFFIETNWQSSDDDEGDQKKKKKKGKKKKQPKSRFQPPKTLDVFVERKARVGLKALIESPDKPSIIMDRVELHCSKVDESLFHKLGSMIGVSRAIRLANENIDLIELQKNFIDFRRNLVERHLLRLPSAPISQQLSQSKLSDTSILVRSAISLVELFKPNLLEQRLFLNNNRFILGIGSIRLIFVDHPKMTNRDRSVRQMQRLYEEYKRLYSDQSVHRLKRISAQIETIEDKVKHSSEDSDSKDLSMDINLMKRLLEDRDKTIQNRRANLIELLQQWNKIQNKKSKKWTESMKMNLEEDSVDEAKEKEVLKQAVQRRVDQQKLIDRYSETAVPLEQITKNIFLDDGRLPGEPKFKKIEMNLQSEAEKPEFLDLSYSIQISIGDKVITEMECIPLDKSYVLSWKQFYSIPVMFPLSDPMSKQDYWNVSDFLPTLTVEEKLPGEEKRPLGSVTLDTFPHFNQKSPGKGEEVSKRIEISDSEDKVDASIRFLTYWNTVPSVLENNSATVRQLELMFDSEKRKIKEIENLDQIHQRLHDLHYMANEDGNDYQRQIDLMQLLLQQKYQIEFANLHAKQNKLKTKATKLEKEPKQFPDGIFCSDEEIENSKRFQMMILRNSGDSHYRDYRFMPLTSTDVLLSNTGSQRSEKFSTDLLLEFIRQSGEKQAKRLEDPDESTTESIDHRWCMTAVNPTTRSNSPSSWLQTVANVLHRLRQDNYSLYADGSNQQIVSINQIVSEPIIEAFSGTGFSFFNPFTSNRKLNPSRKDRRKAAISIFEAINRDIQVVLVIQNALNVPLKIEESESSDTEFAKCSTYVEMKLDAHQTIYTSVADGTQPTWNENFKFKIKLNPKQNVYLNLFEVIQSPVEENSESLTPEPELSKMEKCWLGQLKIPLYSLLFNSKIEGTFALSSPYFLPSYKSLQSSLSNLVDEDYGQSGGGPRFISAINQLRTLHDEESASLLGCLPNIGLSLFLTTDPPIDSTFNINHNLSSLEPKELLNHCNRWKQYLHNQFPDRRHQCLVVNLEHKQVLASRFLSPIRAPPFEQLIKLNEGPKTKKSKLKLAAFKEQLYQSLLIRFVSLIPSLIDSTNVSSLNGTRNDSWLKNTVWLDCVQFCSLRLGLEVEHAVLLCCFLLALDKSASLITGNSLLDGPTAYVIIFPQSEDPDEDYNPIIIDAKRGQQFSAKDYTITLISVDTIITTDNIYANIQKQTHPNRINFNLQKTNQWYRLFGRKAEFQIEASVQPASIDYGGINGEEVASLETRLDGYLREQFMNWRRQHTGSYTVFNRYCTQIIKQLLPKLEYHSAINGARNQQQPPSTLLRQFEEDFIRECDEIYSIHKIISYPINISYREFEQISRLIYSTGIHLAHFGVPNSVEFIIATYVHPYPCNVYSIWIFIAALVPKSILG